MVIINIISNSTDLKHFITSIRSHHLNEIISRKIIKDKEIEIKI